MTATVWGMPAKPRAIRVEDDLWTAAQAAARRRGTTVSAVVVAALQALVDDGAETPEQVADRVRVDVGRLEEWARGSSGAVLPGA